MAWSGMGRERSLSICLSWGKASSELGSGSLRPIRSSMPVVKSIRAKGVEKSTSVGFNVPFLLNWRICAAMPEKRLSVVDMRSSKWA